MYQSREPYQRRPSDEVRNIYVELADGMFMTALTPSDDWSAFSEKFSKNLKQASIARFCLPQKEKKKKIGVILPCLAHLVWAWCVGVGGCESAFVVSGDDPPSSPAPLLCQPALFTSTSTRPSTMKYRPPSGASPSLKTGNRNDAKRAQKEKTKKSENSEDGNQQRKRQQKQ